MFERVKLATHIGSGYRFSRRIYTLCRKLQRQTKKTKHQREKVNKAINHHDIVGIKHSFVEFLASELNEEKTIHEIKKDEFIVEHKLINDVNKIEKSLLAIFKENSIDKVVKHEIHNTVMLMHEIFRKIRVGLQLERQKMRDLAVDKEKLRDISLMPDAIIFQIIRIAARQETKKSRREMRKIKKVLNELDDFLHYIHNETPTPQEARKKAHKLADILVSFDGDLLSEFEKALLLEDQLVIISFRIKIFNQYEDKKLYEILRQGFPKNIFTELEQEEQFFINQLNNDERNEYRNAQILFGEATQTDKELRYVG